jgi:hypothetical protein
MKPFFCLIIFLICNETLGQIENVKQTVVIGTIIPKRTISAELSYIVQDDRDTLYALMFRNRKYKYISRTITIHFSGRGATFQSLYIICKSVFLDKNKQNRNFKVEFKLGNEQVSVAKKRTMVSFRSLLMFSLGSAYCYLTERQVDKLFGKRE